MKICFIADTRSPIARNWIDHFIQRGHDVHVISSASSSANGLHALSSTEAPIFFLRSSSNGTNKAALQNGGASIVSGVGRRVSRLLHEMRAGQFSQVGIVLFDWLAPLAVSRHLRRIRRLLDDLQPDLVHALRIPVEGILAALTTNKAPLLISVWGNDFTLHASHYSPTRTLTKLVLRRADALLTDCSRDLELAKGWGFDEAKPSRVLPGAGGIQSDLFYPASDTDRALIRVDLNIPDVVPVVINPRGFRGYVRNDVFFRAIPIVLQQRPGAIFLCSGMRDAPLALRWVNRLGIGHAVRLLPIVPRERMADLFRLADVMVSPSLHDGTPNTLLEGMACGCFPVAGDIESVREWIKHKVNGLLCDSSSPESLAQAILHALADTELRRNAREVNLKLIAERADYGKVMGQAEEFYRRVVETSAKSKRATRLAPVSHSHPASAG